MDSAGLTFPLIPRHRLRGLSFGAHRSVRRGTGSDVAGARPYRPGDDLRSIDWNASARLSSARQADEFVVRESYAEDAPRVVVVADRRPAMALFPRDLPWLSKRDALLAAAETIAASAAEERALFGYLDFAEGGQPFWQPPLSQRATLRLEESHLAHGTFNAPADTLARALEHLLRARRSLPAGTFVFVLSDFLAPPAPELWMRALEQRWDLVAVVIQDPVWEQSFPAVGGIAVPIIDAVTGRREILRLTVREARERRAEHERRLRELLGQLLALELEPVLLSSSRADEVLEAFLGWALQRLSLAAEWRRPA